VLVTAGPRGLSCGLGYRCPGPGFQHTLGGSSSGEPPSCQHESLSQAGIRAAGLCSARWAEHPSQRGRRRPCFLQGRWNSLVLESAQLAHGPSRWDSHRNLGIGNRPGRNARHPDGGLGIVGPAEGRGGVPRGLTRCCWEAQLPTAQTRRLANPSQWLAFLRSPVEKSLRKPPLRKRRGAKGGSPMRPGDGRACRTWQVPALPAH